MLCRVADDAFWMARYVERAVSVSRLIDVTRHLELDAGEAEFWTPLVGQDVAQDDAQIRFWLSSDEANPSSLVSCVRRARELARGIREAISSEMWEELNQLHVSLTRPTSTREIRGDPIGFHRLVRERLQHFQGLADATLAHDEEWHFLNLGTYLERADDVARVVRRQAHLLAGGHGGDDAVRWLAVLRSCGSAEAYARFYSLRVEPARIVEFLVLNPVFPQSVRFSLGAVRTSLGEAAALRRAAGNEPGPSLRTLGRVHALVEHTAVDEIFERGLDPFLGSVQADLERVSDEITATYLRDQPTPARLAGAARAAMLMAEQQQ